MYSNYLFGHKQPLLFMALVLSVLAQSIQASESTTEIEATSRFTVDTLVEWVLAANPGLHAIQAAAESAAYRIDPAASLDDPTVSYTVAPLTLGSGRLNQRFDLSQKLPWPGTLAAREAAARHQAGAVEYEFDALRLQIIAQTKAAYAEWRFVNEAMTIHHHTRALLDELIVTAQTRYLAGRGLRQDVLQAEVERSNLDKHLLLLQRQQISIQARINALLNRAPDSALPIAAATSLPTTLPVFATLQAQALSRHPELARLDEEIASRRARSTLAEKAFYPDFRLGVGYNSLWNDSEKRPVFAFAINVPLDRSKRRAQLNRARADTREAEWRLVEQRNALLAALTQAHAEASEAQAALRLYDDKLVPLAIDYLEAAIIDYQSGGGSFLSVISAEQGKLNTELELARTHADYLRALAELERWLGSSVNSARSVYSGAQQ